MARERFPRGEVMQAAHGVLDKYKMNRSFFVRTDQDNCDPVIEAYDPLTETKNVPEENAVNPENDMIDVKGIEVTTSNVVQ